LGLLSSRLVRLAWCGAQSSVSGLRKIVKVTAAKPCEC
jgi:hypothetical protein